MVGFEVYVRHKGAKRMHGIGVVTDGYERSVEIAKRLFASGNYERITIKDHSTNKYITPYEFY